jgi:Electron transfer DM13
MGMNVRRDSSIAVKIASALAVIAIVIAGIWVSGGVITNDFGLAMALTAVWMGIAAVACLAIGWRRPGLRVPVIGAYLLTAIVAGVLLGRSTLFEDTVNEKVVRVTPPASEGASRDRRTERPKNLLLRRGRFEAVAHPAEGTATTIRTASGERVLTLTGFEVDNGPDLRLYLAAGPARDESEVDDFEDLGALKGNKGNQQYELPRSLDLERYTTVVVWCRAFSVNFARALLA